MFSGVCVCVADGRHRSVSGSGPGGVLEEASGGNHSGRLQQSQVPTQTFAHLTPELTVVTDFESAPAETSGLFFTHPDRKTGQKSKKLWAAFRCLCSSKEVGTTRNTGVKKTLA